MTLLTRRSCRAAPTGLKAHADRQPSLFSAVGVVRRTPAVTWLAILLGPPAMVFPVWESASPGTDWVVLTSAALHVSLVILEEAAGVFYVALVVSRLVGLAISRSTTG